MNGRNDTFLFLIKYYKFVFVWQIGGDRGGSALFVEWPPVGGGVDMRGEWDKAWTWEVVIEKGTGC